MFEDVCDSRVPYNPLVEVHGNGDFVGASIASFEFADHLRGSPTTDTKRGRINDTGGTPVIVHERKRCQHDIKCFSVKLDVYLDDFVHGTRLDLKDCS